MTRGIRNNNPLNIRKVPGTHWQGEVLPLRGSGEGAGDKKFVQFKSIEWGIRAACCILKTYQRKYQATCVEDIITRWAPPSENATSEYIRTVCRLTGFGGKERLREQQWLLLVQVMALVESKMCLSDAELIRGYDLYLKLKKK